MTAPPRLTLEEARRRHDAAREELGRLCEGKRFRMSIPAQPDDSDVILGDALQALKALTEGHDLAPRDPVDLTTAYMVGFEKGKDAARDDTAELVEALKDVTAALMAADPKAHFKADVERAEAALARVKGGGR